MKSSLAGLLAAVVTAAPAIADERATENVILVTLDGARTQELFGGYDIEIARSRVKDGKVEATPSYRRYWAATPSKRREKLMPFFWGRLMTRHGSIAGNRALGSTVLLRNGHRFSYPGYSEILTGQAHDDVINSNDSRRNPYPTVLEFLREKLEVGQNRVACFASWEVFNWIVSSREDAIFANAGFEAYEHPDAEIAQLSRLQFLTPTPWDTVRHDVYTFRFALAHLEQWKPPVLYLALGETDDWSHDGRYDRTLDALERTDRFLRRLWEYLQAEPQYGGKTTIVITTDHGRGNTPGDWTDHGAKVEGAQYIWMAFIGPDTAMRGEWSNTPTVYADQVAATLCRFLGLDWSERNSEAGKPIDLLFEGK